MDYSFYLKNNTPDKDKLIKFGFSESNGDFVFKKNLQTNSLYVIITISNTKIDMRIIDSTFNEDFIPFGIKNNQRAEKIEAENILNDIINNCFVSSDIRSIIVNYLKNKYGTIYETPWEKYPNYCTFKTNNSNKWYALIMNIKSSLLGLKEDNLIDVINVKVSPEKIPTLIDNKHYFRAYHMNKKMWLTILLDKSTDIEKLMQLLDESFRLVEK